MLQSLPIALANVKEANTSQNLQSEIRQIIYSLYQANEITKTLYSNIRVQCSYNTKWILHL